MWQRLHEQIWREHRTMEVYCTEHPLAVLRPRLTMYNIIPARALHRITSGSRVRVCGLLVFIHSPPTRSGKRVLFVTLEDETGLLDLVAFPDAQRSCAATLFTSDMIAVEGILKRKGKDGISISIVVKRTLVPLCGGLSSLLSPAHQAGLPWTGKKLRDKEETPVFFMP